MRSLASGGEGNADRQRVRLAVLHFLEAVLPPRELEGESSGNKKAPAMR